MKIVWKLMDQEMSGTASTLNIFQQKIYSYIIFFSLQRYAYSYITTKMFFQEFQFDSANLGYDGMCISNFFSVKTFKKWIREKRQWS